MSYFSIFVIISFLGRILAQTQCSGANLCEWPIAKKGGDISGCRCGVGFMNISDTCCLNQWWIVGLSLGVFAFTLVIILVLVRMLMIKRKEKKNIEDLLALNQDRLHQSRKNGYKQTDEDTTREDFKNVATDPMQAHTPEEHPPIDAVEFRNSAYQPDDDFQRQSRLIMNKRRSNFLGYQPTAMVSEEVASMAQDRRSSLNPNHLNHPMHPNHPTHPNHPSNTPTHPNSHQQNYPSFYLNRTTIQPSEFTIKRPTLNDP